MQFVVCELLLYDLTLAIGHLTSLPQPFTGEIASRLSVETSTILVWWPSGSCSKATDTNVPDVHIAAVLS